MKKLGLFPFAVVIAFLAIGNTNAQSINVTKGLGDIRIGQPFPSKTSEVPDLMNEHYNVASHTADILKISHGLAPELSGVADTLGQIIVQVWDGKVCGITYETVYHDKERLIRDLEKCYGKPRREYLREENKNMYMWSNKKASITIGVILGAFALDKSMGRLLLDISKQPETKEMMLLLAAQQAQEDGSR
ncbi:MAG: hypothetical protein M1469_04110 [Bacteroidetes bacterium]|nr:hypothetical protein [Bacteroidota bacterium]